MHGSAVTQKTSSLTYEGRVPLVIYDAVQMANFIPDYSHGEVAEPYILFLSNEYHKRDEQHEITSREDLDSVIHRGIIEGYQIIIDCLSNSSADRSGSEIITPDCIISKQIIVAESNNLDLIEKVLQSPGLKRIKSSGQDMIIIRISTWGQNVILDDELKEKGVEVWRGLRTSKIHFPETYLILKEKMDHDYFEFIRNASEKIFHLSLNGIMISSLIWANVEYSRLVERTPFSKPTNLKEHKKLYDALGDIQSRVSHLRRIQLLTQEWVFLNHNFLDSNNDNYESFVEIFDSEIVLKARENQNISVLTRQENLLENRLSSLENSIKLQLDISGANVELHLTKKFGSLSAILGAVVLFEVIASFLSWLLLPDDSSSLFVWILFISIAIVTSAAIYWTAVKD
jgi:hypothetical protein